MANQLFNKHETTTLNHERSTNYKLNTYTLNTYVIFSKLNKSSVIGQREKQIEPFQVKNIMGNAFSIKLATNRVLLLSSPFSKKCLEVIQNIGKKAKQLGTSNKSVNAWNHYEVHFKVWTKKGESTSEKRKFKSTISIQSQNLKNIYKAIKKSTNFKPYPIQQTNYLTDLNNIILTHNAIKNPLRRKGKEDQIKTRLNQGVLMSAFGKEDRNLTLNKNTLSYPSNCFFAIRNPNRLLF